VCVCKLYADDVKLYKMYCKQRQIIVRNNNDNNRTTEQNNRTSDSFSAHHCKKTEDHIKSSPAVRRSHLFKQVVVDVSANWVALEVKVNVHVLAKTT